MEKKKSAKHVRTRKALEKLNTFVVFSNKTIENIMKKERKKEERKKVNHVG